MFLPAFRFVVIAVLVLAARPVVAEKKPSAELERAEIAADRARALPKGAEYGDAVQAALGSTTYEILRDCMGHYPGWQWPRGFSSVLIIGKTGKLKWIICDARDPNTTCALKKLLKATFPPPPADSWPVAFNFGIKRHRAGSG